jgi:alpha-tubulin suppressor-like RCC1 family protein
VTNTKKSNNKISCHPLEVIVLKRMRGVSKLLLAITLLFLLTISVLGNGGQQANAAVELRPEIIQLSASNTHMSALTKDGTVWMWGQNGGLFGNGSLESSNEPLKNPYLKNIVSVASGESHAMALDNTGHVWTWGQNNFGQIGDGLYTHYGKPNAKGKSEISEDNTQTIPYKVEGLPRINRIATGQNQSFAMAEDGSVWAWGNSWLNIIDRGYNIGGHEDI